MIKIRYYCDKCIERREAEVLYDKDDNLFVPALNGQKVISRGDYLLYLEGDLSCQVCGNRIQRYKIIRDRPERKVNKDGVILIKGIDERKC